MRSATGAVVAAVVLGALAALVWTGSRLERRLARAEQQMATLNLGGPAATYAELAGTFAWTESLPWLFGETRADIVARQAAIRYWQADYGGLLADYGDVASAEVGENLPLQFIIANAAYRAGLAAPADRAQLLSALDGAIGAYRGVLQESPGHRDAAYNYEYLLRLRADVAAGAEPPDRRQSLHGQEGESPEDVQLEDIKIYVPVQRDVDPEMDEAPTLGAGSRIRRRG